MTRLLKIFFLVVYNSVSLGFIFQLINAPLDIAFYLGWLWLVLNAYFIYYLIKNKKLK